MGVDFSTQVYLYQYNYWARPVTFYPVRSQPLVTSYEARGIFNTVSIEMLGMDGSDISEMRTILDILEEEFPIMPMQQDRLFIPDDPGGMPSVGWFEINDVSTNGGGETTLDLRRWTGALPP